MLYTKCEYTENAYKMFYPRMYICENDMETRSGMVYMRASIRKKNDWEWYCVVHTCFWRVFCSQCMINYSVVRSWSFVGIFAAKAIGRGGNVL